MKLKIMLKCNFVVVVVVCGGHRRTSRGGGGGAAAPSFGNFLGKGLNSGNEETIIND